LALAASTARASGEGRGHQHLDELAADLGFGRRGIDRAVEGDDAAEGRGRIGGERALR
jgi:hypothetical protein